MGYEIVDVTSEHAAALRGELADYIAHARRTSARRRQRTSSAPTGRSARAGQTAPGPVERDQNRAIRAWAKAHGYTVPDRGRIPAALVETYHRGESTSPTPPPHPGHPPKRAPQPGTTATTRPATPLKDSGQMG